VCLGVVPSSPYCSQLAYRNGISFTVVLPRNFLLLPFTLCIVCCITFIDLTRFNPTDGPATRTTHNPSYRSAYWAEMGLILICFGFERIGVSGPNPYDAQPYLKELKSPHT